MSSIKHTIEDHDKSTLYIKQKIHHVETLAVLCEEVCLHHTQYSGNTSAVSLCYLVLEIVFTFPFTSECLNYMNKRRARVAQKIPSTIWSIQKTYFAKQ